MRRSACLALFLLFTAAPSFALDLGQALQLSNATPISAILDGGEGYLGQRLQVRGMIVDVCASRGCWVYVAGDRPFEKLRVKVNDGEIVFPLEARGTQVRVEGILEKLDLSREEVVKRRRHQAEERGEEFDPTSVTKGEVLFQLRGLGARIEEL